MENQRFFGRMVKKISNRMPQLDKVGWDSRHNAVGFYSDFGDNEGAARGNNASGYSGIGAVVGREFHSLSIRENLEKVWNSDFVRTYVTPDAISIGYAGTGAGLKGMGGSINLVLLTRGPDAGLHTTITYASKEGFEFSYGPTIGYASRINGLTGGLAPVKEIIAQSMSGRGAEGSVNWIVGITAGVGMDNYNVPTWLEFSGGKAGIGGSGGFTETWVDSLPK